MSVNCISYTLEEGGRGLDQLYLIHSEYIIRFRPGLAIKKMQKIGDGKSGRLFIPTDFIKKPTPDCISNLISFSCSGDCNTEKLVSFDQIYAKILGGECMNLKI